jgi:hypothetical protein
MWRAPPTLSSTAVQLSIKREKYLAEKALQHGIVNPDLLAGDEEVREEDSSLKNDTRAAAASGRNEQLVSNNRPAVQETEFRDSESRTTELSM